MFANRAKEVGIRKVLGAQPANLVVMLLKNFTLLVIIGILIALPIAWMIMTNWLQNFNFRIDLSPAIFVLSALGIIIIAWLTLGYLTIRTATSNPIDSIRDE
jgi:ABC-type antimicrobial peptide transport system permease subunit